MDETIKRLSRELAEAMSGALSQSADVQACHERAREAGFEMRVNVEAIVNFASRAPAGDGAVEPVTSTALVPRRPYDMTVNDRRFLRALRIAAEEAKVEEIN